jgi:hypothetical protein
MQGFSAKILRPDPSAKDHTEPSQKVRKADFSQKNLRVGDER